MIYGVNKIYHIGIIDYLQDWNVDKKIEAGYKVVCKGRNRDTISASNPMAYAKRFQRFVKEEVF